VVLKNVMSVLSVCWMNGCDVDLLSVYLWLSVFGLL